MSVNDEGCFLSSGTSYVPDSPGKISNCLQQFSHQSSDLLLFHQVSSGSSVFLALAPYQGCKHMFYLVVLIISFNPQLNILLSSLPIWGFCFLSFCTFFVLVVRYHPKAKSRQLYAWICRCSQCGYHRPVRQKNSLQVLSQSV